MKSDVIRKSILSANLLAGTIPVLFLLLCGLSSLNFWVENGEWPLYSNIGEGTRPLVPPEFLLPLLLLSSFGMLIIPACSLLHFLLSLRWKMLFPKPAPVLVANAGYALFIASFFVEQTRDIYSWLLD